MAGLYIHIPFCKSRCLYCDFYSTTSLDMRQRYVDAMCRELDLREKSGVDTIYIGGGTPSQLSFEQLQQLLIYIYKVCDVSPDAEVTMEVNPDDVTTSFAQVLPQLPINRISMGAQTFNDSRLQFLRRRHTAAQVPLAVERLRQACIRNISVDLMYGFPNETLTEWDEDITSVLSLQVEHLSAYALQYEEGTPLYRLLQRDEVSEVDTALIVVEGVFALGEVEKLIEFLAEINGTPNTGFPQDIALAKCRIRYSLLGHGDFPCVEVAQIVFIFGVENVLCIDSHSSQGKHHEAKA